MHRAFCAFLKFKGIDVPGQPRGRKKRPRNPAPVVEDFLEGELKIGGGREAGVTLPTSTPLMPKPSPQDRREFERIMEDVLAVEKEEELPGLLTKHFDFLLSVDVTLMTNDLIRCGGDWWLFLTVVNSVRTAKYYSC